MKVKRQRYAGSDDDEICAQQMGENWPGPGGGERFPQQGLYDDYDV